MKNEHKKSRGYLNMEIPLEKLARPRTKSERAKYARRLDWEREQDMAGDYSQDSIYYHQMTDKERRLDDKMSHDYLNRKVPFEAFGRPRNEEEQVLFRYRYNSQYGYLGDYYDYDDNDDDDDDFTPVKVMDQQGNLLTDLDDPCGLKRKGHVYYLDMEHPLTFDWFDVPQMHGEVELYNQRVDLDPALTEADKLVEIPWPDAPGATYNEENGMWEIMTPKESEIRFHKNRRMPQGTYKVIGLGACGSCAVDCVSRAEIWDVEPVAMDMSWPTLETSKAPRRRWLWEYAEEEAGDEEGSLPGSWEKAPQNDNEQTIREITNGRDTILLALGLGGRNGTKSMPLLLSIAKEDTKWRSASYVVGMATLPFGFEGKERQATAEESLSQLRRQADVVFVLPGDTLLETASQDFPLLADSAASVEWTKEAAFRLIACVLGHSATAMATLLASPEEPKQERVNQWNRNSSWAYEIHEEGWKPDIAPQSNAFGPNTAEMQELMEYCIPTSPGIGEGMGENATAEATKKAIASTLIGDALAKASCVLLHVMCNPNRLDFSVTSPAIEIVEKAVGNNVRILSGASGDESLGEAVRVTVFAIVPDEAKRETARQAMEAEQEVKRRAEKKAAERNSKYRGRTILRWVKKLTDISEGKGKDA